MLASTVQFSSNHRPPPGIPTPTDHHHPPPPKEQRAPATSGSTGPHGPDPGNTPTGLFPQDPTACQADPRRTSDPPFPPHSKLQAYLEATDPTDRPVVDVPPSSTTPRTLGEGMGLDTSTTPRQGDPMPDAP